MNLAGAGAGGERAETSSLTVAKAVAESHGKRRPQTCGMGRGAGAGAEGARAGAEGAGRAWGPTVSCKFTGLWAAEPALEAVPPAAAERMRAVSYPITHRVQSVQGKALPPLSMQDSRQVSAHTEACLALQNLRFFINPRHVNPL